MQSLMKVGSIFLKLIYKIINTYLISKRNVQSTAFRHIQVLFDYKNCSMLFDLLIFQFQFRNFKTQTGPNFMNFYVRE